MTRVLGIAESKRFTPTWIPGLAVSAVALLLALWSPPDAGLTLCPIRTCTGVACPGCGLTRATSRLLHGDFAGAAAYHPLALLIVVQLVIGAAAWPLIATKRLRVSTRHLNAVLMLNTSALVAVWVIRATAGTLPA